MELSTATIDGLAQVVGKAIGVRRIGALAIGDRPGQVVIAIRLRLPWRWLPWSRISASRALKAAVDPVKVAGIVYTMVLSW